MLRRVDLVRTHVSEERIASIIRVIICELRSLAVTSNRNTLLRNTMHSIDIVILRSVLRLLVTANVVSSSPSLVTLMMEAIRSSGTSCITRATWRNIPEDGVLHSHRRDSLKSYTISNWLLRIFGCDSSPTLLIMQVNSKFLSWYYFSLLFFSHDICKGSGPTPAEARIPGPYNRSIINKSLSVTGALKFRATPDTDGPCQYVIRLHASLRSRRNCRNRTANVNSSRSFRFAFRLVPCLACSTSTNFILHNKYHPRVSSGPPQIFSWCTNSTFP
jgi:hypothetical protein